MFILRSHADELLSFEDQQEEIKIKSKIIDIKRKKQTIEFVNNVIIESGDSSLLADWMSVIYDEDNDNKVKNDSKIKKIIAKGNVKIFTNEFTATSQKGHFDPNKDVFVLEDNVIVNNGLSIASGNHFLYDLKNKKGIFIGDKNESNISGINQNFDKIQQNNENSENNLDNRVKVIINSTETNE